MLQYHCVVLTQLWRRRKCHFYCIRGGKS